MFEYNCCDNEKSIFTCGDSISRHMNDSNKHHHNPGPFSGNISVFGTLPGCLIHYHSVWFYQILKISQSNVSLWARHHKIVGYFDDNDPHHPLLGLNLHRGIEFWKKTCEIKINQFHGIFFFIFSKFFDRNSNFYGKYSKTNFWKLCIWFHEFFPGTGYFKFLDNAPNKMVGCII